MNRIIHFVGILGIFYLIFAGGAWLYYNNTFFFDQFFFGLGILALILGIVYLLYWKEGFDQAGLTIVLGSGLKQAFHKFFDEQPQPSQSTKAELATHIVWRLTRLGIVGFLLAILPIWLLMNQNQLLEKQNDKINLQNNLIEADRRSSLVFLMSNILDRIDQEITLQKQDASFKDSLGYSLSDPLIGRIAALSQGFIPYRYLEGDILVEKAVSPERGQLLLSLAKSKLNSTSYLNIFRSTNFNYAYLKGANLRRVDLREADLNEADLNEADLRKANLSNANLSEANLDEADLRNAGLEWADLSGANLSEANLREANLSEADLRLADLREAFLSKAILREADLREADLQEADLREADLRGAILSEADLRGADLSEANLQGADLRGANLRRVDLRGADLRKAYLDGAFLGGASLGGADLGGANLREADFSNIRYLILDQLKETKTLFECRNLDDQLKQQLKKDKPCLFTPAGCY